MLVGSKTTITKASLFTKDKKLHVPMNRALQTLVQSPSGLRNKNPSTSKQVSFSSSNRGQLPDPVLTCVTSDLMSAVVEDSGIGPDLATDSPPPPPCYSPFSDCIALAKPGRSTVYNTNCIVYTSLCELLNASLLIINIHVGLHNFAKDFGYLISHFFNSSFLSLQIFRISMYSICVHKELVHLATKVHVSSPIS